jgi:hypothetical protein
MEKEFNNFSELCDIVENYCKGECQDCPIQYCMDENFKINGVFDNEQTIEVKKIYFLGKDNKMYYWYITKNNEDDPMPNELSKNIKQVEINSYNDYIRTDWFEIDKNEIELLKLYDEQGNIVE